MITVTVVESGLTDTCMVTVVESGFVKVTGVDILVDEIPGGEPGSVVTVPYTVSPSNATNPSVVWSFSNDNLILKNGVIMVSDDAIGDCVVTVTTVDGAFSDSAKVVVRISTEADVIISGNTASVDTGSIEEIIGSATSSDLDISVDVTGTGVDTVVIDDAAMGSIVEAGTTVSVITDSATVAFDRDFLSDVAGNGDLCLKVGETTDLSDRQMTLVGDEFIAYSFDLTVGGSSVSQFDDGTARVTVGYDPSWDLEWLKIFHFMDNGMSESVDWTLGAEAGTVEFTAYGFSIYALSYDAPKFVTGVELDKEQIQLDEGMSMTLVETVLPFVADNKDVVWISSDESVAIVDFKGRVTAVKAGTATITVTTVDGGYTDTCEVTVRSVEIPVTGVTMNRTSATLAEGDTMKLTATVAPMDATDVAVSWKSSDTSVATVGSDGTVEAVKAGTATIIVTTSDGGYTATCKITVESEASGTDNTMLFVGIVVALVLVCAVLVAVMLKRRNV